MAYVVKKDLKSHENSIEFLLMGQFYSYIITSS